MLQPAISTRTRSRRTEGPSGARRRGRTQRRRGGRGARSRGGSGTDPQHPSARPAGAAAGEGQNMRSTRGERRRRAAVGGEARESQPPSRGRWSRTLVLAPPHAACPQRPRSGLAPLCCRAVCHRPPSLAPLCRNSRTSPAANKLSAAAGHDARASCRRRRRCGRHHVYAMRRTAAQVALQSLPLLNTNFFASFSPITKHEEHDVACTAAPAHPHAPRLPSHILLPLAALPLAAAPKHAAASVGLVQQVEGADLHGLEGDQQLPVAAAACEGAWGTAGAGWCMASP